MLNPFSILVILIVIAALGWRGVRREKTRVTNALREAEAALQKRKTAAQRSVTLERDPKTGVYRPPGGE